MGNCCCNAHYMKMTIDQEQVTMKGTFSYTTPEINRQKSIPFNRENFIKTKNKNIYDDYEFKEKLGKGAYGSVYKVIHKRTKLVRAVKLISKRITKKKIDFTLWNEFSFLKAFDHPNIIKLFECYIDDNFYYLVEEYCVGGDLFSYLKTLKHFNENTACEIMWELLLAINYLHSHKIVHRDIKPENIVFLNKLGKKENDKILLKLIDFGVSIYINDHALTQELGTLFYIAPEVLKNNYNEKCDIWSYGIVLYMILCGYPPYRGGKDTEVKNKILNDKVEFDENDWKYVSNEAKNFIKSLLQKDPNNRPSAQSALENVWFNRIKKQKNKKQEFVCLKTVENLTKFSSTILLQKAALSYITFQTTQNEQMKELIEEFNKIDLNGDGVLSRDEIIQCLNKVYPLEEAKEKTNKIFEEIDFNNDGTINYNEFISVNMKKDQICTIDNLKMAFNMFDLDGNGFITKDELKETLQTVNDNITLDDLIKEVDTDGDNQISFDEFQNMMDKICLMSNN